MCWTMSKNIAKGVWCALSIAAKPEFKKDRECLKVRRCEPLYLKSLRLQPSQPRCIYTNTPNTGYFKLDFLLFLFLLYFIIFLVGHIASSSGF